MLSRSAAASWMKAIRKPGYRRTRLGVSGVPATSYNYDGRGNLQLVDYPSGTTDLSFTYAIGELKNAAGRESGGSTKRLGEQFGYVYDAAGNLTTRTNGDNTGANFLKQTLGVNNLNQLTTGSRSGTLTVSGFVVGSPTSVTIQDNGNGPVAATVYGDGTYARAGISIPNANNIFIATATDSVGTGRTATHSLTVNLPTTPTFSYDSNGNLSGDGKRVFVYNAENQLTQVYEANKWRSDFAYDGKVRIRIRKEYTWSSAWVQTNECRYVYDGNLVIQERNVQNLPGVTYTRGKDLSGSRQGAGGIGGMLARTDVGTGKHAYYHADGNGPHQQNLWVVGGSGSRPRL